MVITNKFRKAGEPIVATYQFEDVANGSGVVAFLLGVEASNTVTSYKLSSTPFYSDTVEILQGVGTVTYDFKTNAFGSQRVSEGIANINMAQFAGGASPWGSLKVTLIRLRGVTETTIGAQVQTHNPPAVNPPATNWRMAYTEIPLTRTTFIKGDILICRVEFIVANGNPSFGTDPIGRDGAQITSSLTLPSMTTKSTLFMPFNIEI